VSAHNAQGFCSRDVNPPQTVQQQTVARASCKAAVKASSNSSGLRSKANAARSAAASQPG
jgi:hypothetical protein